MDIWKIERVSWAGIFNFKYKNHMYNIFSQGPGFMSTFLQSKDPFGISQQMNSAVKQLEKEKKINNLYKLRKRLQYYAL